MATWGRLRVLDGANEGTVFVLARPIHSLGRSVVNDFRVPEPTVSRQQAEFRCDDQGVLLVGVSEKNPLWVNGEVLRGPRRIHPGDKITCGLVHILYEEEPEAAPGPSSPAESPPPHLESVRTVAQGEAAPAAAPPAGIVRCSRCGGREHPGARYCGTCGMPLLQSAKGPPTTVHSSPTRPDAGGAAEEAAPETVAVGQAPGDGAPAKAPRRPAAPTPRAPEPAPARDPTGDAPGSTNPAGRSPTETMARSAGPSETVHAVPGSAGSEAVPGTILKGRFELRRSLGSSRAAQVFAAWDRKDQKEVAVKVLLPVARSHPGAREQFLAAANAFLVARHDNLLAVSEVQVDGEQVFSVMELLSGVCLRDQVDARPASAGGFPAAEVRHVGGAVCRALEKLHESTVHGNVRPENIWINAQGAVKLMDPGLLPVGGKPAAWPATADLATTLFTAPEVLKGAAPDALSDQYSVGAVLYQMLTGEVPAGRSPPVREVRRDVPETLARAVDRALSVRPGDRFPSAGDLGTAVAGSGRSDFFGRPGGRRLAAVAGVAAAALVVSSVIWFEPVGDWWRRATRDRDLEVQLELDRGSLEEARRGLRALNEFASLSVLEQVAVGLSRGDEARDHWRLEKAAEAYDAVRILIGREMEIARKRMKDNERAESAGEAYVRAESRVAEAGGEIALLVARAENSVGMEEKSAPPSAAGTRAAVEHRERLDSLRRAHDLLVRVRVIWQQELDRPADGSPLQASRIAARRAREVRAAGRFLEAAGEYQAALLLHWKALCGMQEKAVQGILGAAGLSTAGGLPEAFRRRDEAVRAESGDDREAAIRLYAEAESAYRGVLRNAFDDARSSFLDQEKARRCPACGAEGACTACEGKKTVAGDCPRCEGRGTVPVRCPKCAEGKTETCTVCQGRREIAGPCAACAGKGRTPCAKCGDRPLPCPYCRAEGVRTCMRCNGTGKPRARGEKPVCPDCNGTGRLRCSECRGTKTIVCDGCRGEGSFPCGPCGATGNLLGPCGACGGTGLGPCSACTGTGRVQVPCNSCRDGKVTVTCLECGGSGVCGACGGGGRRKE